MASGDSSPRLSRRKGRSNDWALGHPAEIAMQAHDPPRRLRFGVFEVDLRNGELTKSGQRRKLQEQPFQVLAMLLEKPGAYAFIGNGDGSHRDVHHGMGPCTLHNASYDFNDDLIPLGATCWVELAEQWLAQPQPQPERAA